jgi:hypothetical protein
MTREIKTYLRGLVSSFLVSFAIMVWVPPRFNNFLAFFFFTFVSIWLAFVIAISGYKDRNGE